MQPCNPVTSNNVIMHFYPLIVKDIRRETADCVSVAMEIPDALREVFAFHQGQYLTFKTVMDGEEVRRSYSICSCPADDEWRVAVKEVPDGRFSTYVNRQLKKGAVLEVAPPNGRFFTELSPTQAKTYTLFAAGSGITPILSIASSILRMEPLSRVQLFYGNQQSDSIIFLERLEALKNLYLPRFSIHYLLSREQQEEPLLNGRLDREKLETFVGKLFFPEKVDEAFICGPEPMILDLREGLAALGMDPRHIHVELFGVQLARPKPRVEVEHVGKTCAVTIKVDGKTSQFSLPFGTQSILDAALAKGAPLPYACKGGVCCTCKAKLLEGKVGMAVNYGLEPEELERGFVLSCQSYPESDRVSIDFDA